MECLTPPLDAVPVEEWFCPECIANNRTSGHLSFLKPFITLTTFNVITGCQIKIRISNICRIQNKNAAFEF